MRGVLLRVVSSIVLILLPAPAGALDEVADTLGPDWELRHLEVAPAAVSRAAAAFPPARDRSCETAARSPRLPGGFRPERVRGVG